MDEQDIKLLSIHGWEIVNLSPLKIEHLPSMTIADGMIAQLVLMMIKDGAVSFA